jgi:hypothetical protein
VIAIEDGALNVSGKISVSFQRAGFLTFDGSRHSLNLGALSARLVRDYAASFSESWSKREAVFIPLLANERVWLGFSTRERSYAIQTAVGEVNAVSGESWIPGLKASRQNYLVSPPQSHWDGIRTGQDFIPFDSRSLNSDERVAGAWVLAVYAPLRDAVGPARLSEFDQDPPKLFDTFRSQSEGAHDDSHPLRDPLGVDIWSREPFCTVFIVPVTAARYEEITGIKVPTTRTPSEVYTGYRLP